MALGVSDSSSRISERLYIGEIFTSLNRNDLEHYNITHILVCGQELSCRFPEEFTYKKAVN